MKIEKLTGRIKYTFMWLASITKPLIWQKVFLKISTTKAAASRLS